MTIWNFDNTTTNNEYDHLKENIKKTDNLNFPSNLSVSLFISQQTIDGMGNWWLELHENQLKNLSESNLIILNGSHYLHHIYYNEIAYEVNKLQN